MSTTLAPDDVVRDWQDVDPGRRPPLVVADPLAAFLDAHGLGTGELSITPLGAGHSNVTLLVKRGDRTFVLRRGPRPPVPPAAHDMLREARIVHALRDSGVPVAKVLATCDDSAVIGVPFYVMERAPGLTITDVLPDGLEPGVVGNALVDVLAALHAVHPRDVGLQELTKPTGYVERQIRRFVGSWKHNRTREVPEVDLVTRWLGDHLPAAYETTIVHGDYRLGNTLFTSRPTRLQAVLDWELATLGAPLADLGYLLSMWSEPGDEPWAFDLSPVTRCVGFASRRELVERYVGRSRREAEDLRFYVVLALWKNVVIMEGNVRRALEGGSDDPFLRDFGDGVLDIARRAMRVGPGGQDIL